MRFLGDGVEIVAHAPLYFLVGMFLVTLSCFPFDVLVRGIVFVLTVATFLAFLASFLVVVDGGSFFCLTTSLRRALSSAIASSLPELSCPTLSNRVLIKTALLCEASSADAARSMSFSYSCVDFSLESLSSPFTRISFCCLLPSLFGSLELSMTP